jgi:hypothetical protein
MAVAQKKKGIAPDNFIDRIFTLGKKLPGLMRGVPKEDVTVLRQDVRIALAWGRIQTSRDGEETYERVLLNMHNNAVRTLSNPNIKDSTAEQARMTLGVIDSLRRTIEAEKQKGKKATIKLAAIAADK